MCMWPNIQTSAAAAVKQNSFAVFGNRNVWNVTFGMWGLCSSLHGCLHPASLHLSFQVWTTTLVQVLMWFGFVFTPDWFYYLFIISRTESLKCWQAEEKLDEWIWCFFYIQCSESVRVSRRVGQSYSHSNIPKWKNGTSSESYSLSAKVWLSEKPKWQIKELWTGQSTAVPVDHPDHPAPEVLQNADYESNKLLHSTVIRGATLLNVC